MFPIQKAKAISVKLVLQPVISNLQSIPNTQAEPVAHVSITV